MPEYSCMHHPFNNRYMQTCSYCNHALLSQNASDDVCKMIIGNKCDLESSRIISTERGEVVSSVKNMVWLWIPGNRTFDQAILHVLP